MSRRAHSVTLDFPAVEASPLRAAQCIEMSIIDNRPVRGRIRIGLIQEVFIGNGN